MSNLPHVAVAKPPETLTDAFHAAVCLDKPDSPVSTLRNAATITPTSSSGSSAATPPLSGRRSHSGEFLPSAPPRPGHRRSGSGPLIFSGGAVSWTSSTASSPSNVLPAGNICPSGRPAKPAPAPAPKARSDVLGTGTGNYGHGSIVRGGGGGAAADPEEVRKAGNEQYRRGHFQEALALYDRAISMCPDSAACRGNRAAALIGLRRFGEAVRECEAALKIDPGYARAHQRLASLFLRLGQVDSARKHLSLAGPQPDLLELHKLQAVEKHIHRCADARAMGDWKAALRESEAALASGADSSSLIIACRAEAFLHLQQLDEADDTITSASKLDYSSVISNMKFCRFASSSYLYFVLAQVDLALGRFQNAISAAEKARKIDSANSEVLKMLNNVKAVATARALGNELFNSGKFAEASAAYGQGLKYGLINPVLYCNRAACWFKQGLWEKSIEDCNEALRIQPNYTKALLRRAASFDKIERWVDSIKDYETLRKELPDDTEVAEAHFRAQVALKTSRGEEVSNMKFGGEVEAITGAKQFQMAVTLPGVSVVHFMAPTNQNCIHITPFVDTLCARYPSVNFLKVDVNENPAITRAENVRTVPTFRIYKNGTKMKEMICPNQQLLEYSVRLYSV